MKLKLNLKMKYARIASHPENDCQDILILHGSAKRQVEKLHTISAVSRLAFYPQERIKERDFAFKIAYSMMNKIEKYRWKHRSFSFPIELKIADAVARRFKGFLLRRVTTNTSASAFVKHIDVRLFLCCLCRHWRVFGLLLVILHRGPVIFLQ